MYLKIAINGLVFGFGIGLLAWISWFCGQRVSRGNESAMLARIMGIAVTVCLALGGLLSLFR